DDDVVDDEGDEAASEVRIRREDRIDPRLHVADLLVLADRAIGEPADRDQAVIAEHPAAAGAMLQSLDGVKMIEAVDVRFHRSIQSTLMTRVFATRSWTHVFSLVARAGM